MRFCQTDGTPLVEDVPVDPYKTMVASSDEIAAAMNPPLSNSGVSKADDEVLQLPPDSDPKKTMYASEEEIRKEMASVEEPIVELPPLAPEPPKFSEPSLSPPSFGDAKPASPPPSPFATESSSNQPASGDLTGDPFQKTTPPIPSPFDNPKPSTYEPPSDTASGPEIKSFTEPKISEPIAAAASAPVQNWESKEPMQNAPIGSAPAGQNKTLAIVSLVAGILGLTLCCGTILPSLVAAVLGFMARGKATKDPSNYGGAGLALGGIITGILGVVISIAYLIFVFFLGGMQLIMQGTR